VRAVLATALSFGVVVAGAGISQARDQRYSLRDRTSVSVLGHGYGHGRGMSQWGAYGAATAGLTYDQILAFYYPGTALSTQADPQMRVLISADTDNTTHVLPAPGLSICRGTTRALLSTNPSVSSWRLVRIGGVLRLQWYSAGAYHTGKLTISGTSATFTRSTSCTALGAATMTLALPSGGREGIRGGLRAQLDGTQLRTVAVLGMSSYLASVVPSEMPSGWATEALKAQSVAARSYATRYRENSGGPTRLWDICDTTACQVFHGTSAEAASTSAAVTATAGRVLTYGGDIALTEFSASNGGWTTAGGPSTPYLVAKADPYDGRVAAYGSMANPHTWLDTVSITGLQARYPSIGLFVRFDVLGRDGHGEFGGRVTSVVVQGTSGHVTLTGSAFASATGLKSIWWTVRYSGLDHDLTNDGRPDLMVREAATGKLRVYPSTGGTALGAPLINGTGWSAMSQVVVSDDLTGDGASDLVARNATSGTLYVYPGDGAGWVSGYAVLGSGSAYSLIAAPGDFSGDGHADLLAVDTATHDLMLLRGNGAGGLSGSPVSLGTGWDQFDAVFGCGDINGDGYVDVLARLHSTGQLRLYYGNGAGGFKTWTTMTPSYASLVRLTVPGDLNHDGRPDLLGINAAGQLLRYLGTSSGFGPATVIGNSGWSQFDLMG
jgi:SpoIID/LytB domain protein